MFSSVPDAFPAGAASLFPDTRAGPQLEARGVHAHAQFVSLTNELLNLVTLAHDQPGQESQIIQPRSTNLPNGIFLKKDLFTLSY